MRTQMNRNSNTANSLLLDSFHEVKSPCSTVGGLNVLADGAIYSAKKCHSPNSLGMMIPSYRGSDSVRTRTYQDDFSSRLIDSEAVDRCMDLTSAIKIKRRFKHNDCLSAHSNPAKDNSITRSSNSLIIKDKISRSDYENDALFNLNSSSAPFNQSTAIKKTRVGDDAANTYSFSPSHDRVLNNLSLR